MHNEETCAVNHDWQSCFCDIDRKWRITALDFMHKPLYSSFTFDTMQEAEDYINERKIKYRQIYD